MYQFSVKQWDWLHKGFLNESCAKLLFPFTVSSEGSGKLGICHTFLAWLFAEIHLEMQLVLLRVVVM